MGLRASQAVIGHWVLGIGRGSDHTAVAGHPSHQGRAHTHLLPPLLLLLLLLLLALMPTLPLRGRCCPR